MLMSVPGQTVGVSVFTDYLIEALAISRRHEHWVLFSAVLGVAVSFGFSYSPKALKAPHLKQPSHGTPSG